MMTIYDKIIICFYTLQLPDDDDNSRCHKLSCLIINMLIYFSSLLYRLVYSFLPGTERYTQEDKPLR